MGNETRATKTMKTGMAIGVIIGIPVTVLTFVMVLGILMCMIYYHIIRKNIKKRLT